MNQNIYSPDLETLKKTAVQTLFDFLKSSDIDDFLLAFPEASRTQVNDILTWANETIHSKSEYYQLFSDPDIIGGTPAFRGTRVPIQALFDHLEDESIARLMHGYPTVSRENINEVLEISKQALLEEIDNLVFYEENFA